MAAKPFVVEPDDYAPALNIVGEHVTVHWFRFGKGGGEMISMTSRLGASKMFTDFAREVAPVNPDLAKLAEVGARHGLKVAE